MYIFDGRRFKAKALISQHRCRKLDFDDVIRCKRREYTVKEGKMMHYTLKKRIWFVWLLKSSAEAEWAETQF